jgi:hypothetical protein
MAPLENSRPRGTLKYTTLSCHCFVMFEHGLLEPEILVRPITSLENLDLVSSLHESIRLPAARGTTSQYVC